MTAPISPLEFAEGLEEVRVGEGLLKSVDTTPWGDAPTSVSVEVHAWNETTEGWDDVTSTIVPSGTPSVSGNVITLPELDFTSGVAGTLYRVTVQFSITGKGVPFRPFGRLKCIA